MTDGLRLSAPPAPAGTRPGAPPRISVLVPVYDGADTVAEALDSALGQSPPAHEVVVSDDGSRDDLDRALRPFRHRVRVVRGPNAGLATARNRAAAVATGDLLALLDADDVWLPGRTAALSAAASRRPDLAVLTTDAVVVRDGVPDRETYYATRTFAVDDQDVAVLRDNFVFGAGAVRAEAFRHVGGYRDGVRAAEDWDLFLRLLLTGHRAGLVEAPLYEYRRRAASLTGQRLALALGVLDVLALARPLLRRTEQRRQLRRTEQQWRERAASAALASGDDRARALAVRAGLGPLATPRTRARFALQALRPASTVAR